MTVQFLSAEQARQMVELAEQTRAGLARFAGHSVGYEPTSLQLLDEWIDRESAPNKALRLMWGAFLGELFRRHHGGEWIISQDESRQLAILCPTERGGVYQINVIDQINRRIAQGMLEPLTLFYVREAAALRRPPEI